MKSGEAEDMKQLEEQAKLAADALFRRKKELQRWPPILKRMTEVEAGRRAMYQTGGTERPFGRGEAADGGRARGAGRQPWRSTTSFTGSLVGAASR